MAIYMKYEVPTINGGVTTTGFEKQIELTSFQFGIGRGVGAPTGSSSMRESSTPSVSEITVTKNHDEASSGLQKESYGGEGKGKVTISFVRTDAKGGVAYLVYKLTDVMISGYSASSGGDQPSESLSLNYVTISTTFTVQNSDGTAGDPATHSYNLGTQVLS